MELIRAARARVSSLLEALLADPERLAVARIEADARLLVQKLAREYAAKNAVDAVRAADIGNLYHDAEPGDVYRLAIVRARHQNAARHTAAALLALRETLGLPDYPSTIEVAGWGEAP